MRILIVEDEALIAMDLEDLVQARTGADCVVAATVEQAMTHLERGIDFALLDYNLRPRGTTSQPIAEALLARGIPFCFVTANPDEIPAHLQRVRQVRKPFHPVEIERALPRTAVKKNVPRYATPETGAWALAPRHQA